MPDRKSSSGRQQRGMNRGSQWQQSQQSDRDDRQHSSSGGSRKQPQINRTHRSQQR
jgi:hypothetical protein